MFAGDQYGYFPAIPTALLGTRAVLAAPPEISYNTEMRRLPQQFYITALQDSAVLNIKFGGKIGSHANHSDELMSERTVLLQRGDTYVLTSGGQQHDISGTYIHSSTPFSLVSTAYGSHMVEDIEFVDFCITQAQARSFELGFRGISDPLHETNSYFIAHTNQLAQPVFLDTSTIGIDERFVGPFYTVKQHDVSQKSSPYQFGSLQGRVSGKFVREYATDSSFHIALCTQGPPYGLSGKPTVFALPNDTAWEALFVSSASEQNTIEHDFEVQVHDELDSTYSFWDMHGKEFDDVASPVRNPYAKKTIQSVYREPVTFLTHADVWVRRLVGGTTYLQLQHTDTRWHTSFEDCFNTKVLSSSSEHMSFASDATYGVLDASENIYCWHIDYCIQIDSMDYHTGTLFWTALVPEGEILERVCATLTSRSNSTRDIDILNTSVAIDQPKNQDYTSTACLELSDFMGETIHVLARTSGKATERFTSARGNGIEMSTFLEAGLNTISVPHTVGRGTWYVTITQKNVVLRCQSCSYIETVQRRIPS